jgi:DNA repair exonuclease SbcCD nuclease subunit
VKIGLICDTHYNFKKANKSFHEYFSKFYSKVFFPTLSKYKIKTVIHLGDAFDNRRGIDYWALQWAKENVYDKFEEKNITVYSIVGNHDAYYKNSNEINSIDTLLGEYKNVVKITEPSEKEVFDENYVFIPWICSDNQEKTFELLENTKAKIVFGHLELKGFTVYPGHIHEEGLDKDVFKKFDRVFSGHYHTRSDDGKIFYLGNPYQMFWSDVNDKRGFHIFDTETYELTFIQNPFSIFEIISYDESNDMNIDFSLYENKIVKVVIKNKNNQIFFDMFIDNLIKSNPLEVKIIEDVLLYDENIDSDELKVEDTLSILDKYVEEAEFNLDKNNVKKLLREVYKEALEIN